MFADTRDALDEYFQKYMQDIIGPDTEDKEEREKIFDKFFDSFKYYF